MTWTLCTSGAAITKAGANANTDIIASGAALARWSDEAQSAAATIARSDVVANFGSLETNGKEVLQDFCSSFIAQRMIAYDMSGFTSRNEAIMMLNVLENNIGNATRLIKEDRNKTYLKIEST